MPNFLEQVPHTYYDSFCIPGKRVAPQKLLLFQRPIGWLAPDHCKQCGADIEGAHQRTSLDTNIEMCGMIPAPRIFVVHRISMDFKYPLPEKLFKLFGDYHFELQVGRATLFACPVGSITPSSIPNSSNLAEPITVNAGEYLAPQLVSDSDPPPTFPSDIHGYVRLHGDLYMEVRQ
jgi:hypothetical protein